MLGVETRVGRRDRIETGRDGRSALGDVLPALGGGGGAASTGRGDASGGRGGSVTTLSVAGLRTASRAEYGS